MKALYLIVCTIQSFMFVERHLISNNSPFFKTTSLLPMERLKNYFLFSPASFYLPLCCLSHCPFPSRMRLVTGSCFQCINLTVLISNTDYLTWLLYILNEIKYCEGLRVHIKKILSYNDFHCRESRFYYYNMHMLEARETQVSYHCLGVPQMQEI